MDKEEIKADATETEAQKNKAKKFGPPEVGETVNHVAPHSNKISKVKVTAVSDEHDGRVVTVEIPAKRKNADGDEVYAVTRVSVPYRPKEKLAGNTWHFALIALMLSMAVSVMAGIPTYHTISGYGNNTATATAIFPADPNSQIRVVSAYYTSDTATANLLFSSGGTAYSLIWTNVTTTALTNVINSTNGLTIGSAIILQHAGVDYTNYVFNYGNSGTASWTNANGIVLTNSTTTLGIYGQGPVGFAATNVSWVAMGTGGWGVIPLPGDEVYLMNSPVSIFVGAGTNWLNGDDIFSGNYGRPVEVQISTATVTNRLPVLSAHYDSASQP